MALVKFYRGSYASYNKTTHADGVYFAGDKQLIIMNGVEYGGVNLHAFEGFIKDVDVEGQTLSFKKDVNGAWTDVSIKLIEAADNSIELGTITKEGVNDGSTIKVKAVYDDNADGDGLKLTDNGIKVVLDKTRKRLATIEGADTVDGSIKKALKDAKTYTDTEIQKLDLDEVGGEGKVITTISETDGVVSATAIDLKAANVAATATAASDTAVAVEGATVEAQVASLAKSIKDVELAAATYSVKKVETGLASNIKEAYQLVQTVNSKSTDVGVQIPVYKDSSLKSVELVDEDDKGTKGQFLKFTYITSEGTESIVYLNCSKFLVESEFKDGLVVSTAGEVSVKIDASSEAFLTVGENGVKLSGVADAIDADVLVETNRAKAAEETNASNIAANKKSIDILNGDAQTTGSVAKAVADAKAELIGDAADDYNTMGKLEDKIQEVDAKASAAHTKVNAKADGHVTVTVEEKTDATTQTKYSEVTVAENDIASDTDLKAEIAARKAVDGQSGQTYAANTTANYIKAATSLNDADVKLDAALKAEADRAAAAEDKIEASVGLAADGSHVTATGNYTKDATTVVGEIAAVDAQVKKNEDAITILNGANTVVGSVKNTIESYLTWMDVDGGSY